MILDWREATKDDRPLLQRFECTTPPPREPGRRAQPHPKPYEYNVQKAIHTLNVPLHGDDGTVLLGLGPDGDLGAVSVWSSIRAHPGLHKIRLVAVSLAYRGTSADPDVAGKVASETLDVTLSKLSEYAAGERVFGLVDHHNTGSLRLLGTHGFVHLPNGPVDNPDLQMWAARVPS
ncbi:MAG: hypothetical protein QM638_23180 [Nocardioides sp.]|uniref:hypothetical protein n=1 Tax=Nocardioides sp. TaxID=35761 RepID=UPI0039E2FF79